MRWIGYEGMVSDPQGNQKKFQNEDEFITFSVDNVKDIASELDGRKLVIIGAPPGTEGIGGVEKCVNRPSYLPLICTKYLNTDERDTFNKRMNTAIKDAFNGNASVLFVDPYDYLCKDGKCETMSDDYQFIYSDPIHLTKSGAALVWDSSKNKIIKFIE